MSSYRFILPDYRSRTIRFFTGLMLLLNFFLFGLTYTRTLATDSMHSLSLIGMILAFIAVLFFFFKHRFSFLQLYRVEISLAMLSLIWLLIGAWLPGSLMLVLAYLSNRANKPMELMVDDKGIRFNSFPPKQFAWQEVAHVVFKDDLLSIDLRSNKLYQSVVLKNAPDFDALRFNQFCAARIQASA